MKHLAVTLYASGLSLRRTAKLLSVSATAVLNWIKIFGKTECSKPKPEGKIIIMDLYPRLTKIWVRQKLARGPHVRPSTLRPLTRFFLPTS